MKVLKLPKKSRDFYFIIGTLFLFLLLRLPSLFEPYWYGDEGIYQTLGLAINNGRLLYEEIWDNKPPLLYLLYSFVSANQFNIRFLSLIFGSLSIVVFYFLSKNLFQNSRKAVFLAAFIFAVLFGIPLLESNIANAENFMILPTLIAGLIIYKIKPYQIDFSRGARSSSIRQLAIAGLMLSLSFLTKIVAVFDLAAFFVFIIFLNYKDKKSVINILKSIFPFIAAFLCPIILTFFYFYIIGAFLPFYQAVFTQMVGYVGYSNNLLVPQGLLILKIILIFLTILFLFIKRESMPKQLIFIFIWLAFSIFNALFSGRPYTHYLLVLLPSFCLLVGLMGTKYYQKLSLIIFTLLIFTIFYFFSFYKKTIAYYPNFINFITNNKSVNDYYRFFDKSTPRDYEIAEFLKSKTRKEDSIFIWGNNAQVYALTNKLPPGRLTVRYHITANKNTLEETRMAIIKKAPRYIIIIPSNNPFPYSLKEYNYTLTIQDSQIYERIF